jgi:hypothetical protein
VFLPLLTYLILVLSTLPTGTWHHLWPLGTFLNGKRLAPKAKTLLDHDDKLVFGASTRKCRLDLGPTAAAASAAAALARAPPKETAEQWAARKQKEAGKAVMEVREGKVVDGADASSDDDGEASAVEGLQENDEANDDAVQQAADKAVDEEAADEDVDPAAVAERKRKRLEANQADRERKKLAKKAMWAEMKADKKAAKFRKRNWVPKEKSANERLADICGQPTW